MRLTRSNSIQWQEDEATRESVLPTYDGTYNNISFRLEDAVSPSIADFLEGRSSSGNMFDVKYRLLIMDRSDQTEIASPPMKAATDLVRVIRGPSTHKKLRSINERLEAAS